VIGKLNHDKGRPPEWGWPFFFYFPPFLVIFTTEIIEITVFLHALFLNGGISSLMFCNRRAVSSICRNKVHLEMNQQEVHHFLDLRRLPVTEGNYKIQRKRCSL